jgi:hypothetical protein
MIIGAHAIIYSQDPQADRAFLRDVLKFPHVDAGDGWLIFGLPPAELAVHPSDQNDQQEFFLICDDIRIFVQEMARNNITCGEIQDQNWGQIAYITLPGGGQLGVYQPSHARPAALDRSEKSHS